MMSRPVTSVTSVASFGLDVLALVGAIAIALGAGLGCGSHIAASSDAGGDAIPSSDAVMCTGTVGVFPAFDKTCTGADDCVFGVHQTNCCGATLAIGMVKSEQARFDADEKICVAQYPQCACPAQPTVAEDGRNPIGGQAIVVECQSRKCMTTVK